METLIAVWIGGASIVFTASLSITPSEGSSATALAWLALLATLWPVLVVFYAIGYLLILMASIARGD